MDKLLILLSQDKKYVNYIINGKNLVDIIKEKIRIWLDTDEMKEKIRLFHMTTDVGVIGSYKGLHPKTIFHPSRHLLDSPDPGYDYVDGKVVILVCGLCGCSLCDDIAIKITLKDGWKLKRTWKAIIFPLIGKKLVNLGVKIKRLFK